MRHTCPRCRRCRHHRANAASIQARLFVGGANGPITPTTDAILSERGIPVPPDILANTGGVTVSCFEWFQNIGTERCDLETVNRKLRHQVNHATDSVVERRQTLRTAALAKREGEPQSSERERVVNQLISEEMTKLTQLESRFEQAGDQASRARVRGLIDPWLSELGQKLKRQR